MDFIQLITLKAFMLSFRAFMLLKSNSHLKWCMHKFDIENTTQISHRINPNEKFDSWCKSWRANPCSWGKFGCMLHLSLCQKRCQEHVIPHWCIIILQQLTVYNCCKISCNLFPNIKLKELQAKILLQTKRNIWTSWGPCTQLKVILILQNTSLFSS